MLLSQSTGYLAGRQNSLGASKAYCWLLKQLRHEKVGTFAQWKTRREGEKFKAESASAAGAKSFGRAFKSRPTSCARATILGGLGFHFIVADESVGEITETGSHSSERVRAVDPETQASIWSSTTERNLPRTGNQITCIPVYGNKTTILRLLCCATKFSRQEKVEIEVRENPR